MSAPHDDPTPESEPGFHPLNKQFLESLHNLISFKARVENFNRNMVKISTLWSINIAEAAIFAHNEFEGDGWYVTSVERTFDDVFFDNLDPTAEVIDENDESEKDHDDTDSRFFNIIKNIDWD